MRVFTMEEVSRHVTERDTWVVMHGQVYDVTKYLDDHPGGKDLLLDVAGTDATGSFLDAGHSSDASEILEKFAVGRLKGYKSLAPSHDLSALYQQSTLLPQSSKMSDKVVYAAGFGISILTVRLIFRQIANTALGSYLENSKGLPPLSLMVLSPLLCLVLMTALFSYWAAGMIYVDFGYGKYPEIFAGRIVKCL